MYSYAGWLAFFNDATGLAWVSPQGQDVYNFALEWLRLAIQQNLLIGTVFQQLALYNLASHLAIVYNNIANLNLGEPVLVTVSQNTGVQLPYITTSGSNGGSAGSGVIVDQLSDAALQLSKTGFGRQFLQIVQPISSTYRPTL